MTIQNDAIDRDRKNGRVHTATTHSQTPYKGQNDAFVHL